MAIHKYRPEINGLRGIAVLAVVLFHLGFSWAKGGFVGVDVFFVISGYLITQLIISDIDLGQFRFSQFWLRRARRILPALSCTVLFSLIMGWFLFLPDDFKSLGRSAFALTLFSSNFYFWLKTGYFTAPAETKPLLHTWTLAVEEQFYLIFPLLLFLMMRFVRLSRIYFIFLLMIISFALAVYNMRSHQVAAFFLLPTRAWELLIGSWIALYFFKNTQSFSRWVNELLDLFSLSAIAYAILFYHRNLLFPGWAALVPCLGAAGILIANQRQLTLVGRMLSWRPLVALGLISYSWYLWHWPFLVFAKYVAVSELTFIQTLEIFIISLLAAILSYFLIEQPIRQKKVLKPSWALVSASVFAGCVVAITGFMIDATNGLPNRLSPTVLAAYQEAFYQPVSKCQPLKISKNITVCSNNANAKKPDFILWGDSHANVLLPVIEKLAAQNHKTFWYYACIPVLDVYQITEHASLKGSNCYVRNHEMVQFIKDNNVKNVLLVSFWTQYTKGRELLMEGAGQRDPFYADATIKSSSSKEAEKVFQKHFTNTVKELENVGVTIWIMQQVPTHRYWVANQLTKTLKFGGDPQQIGRPFEEYRKRQHFVNNVFKSFNLQNVHLLNPALFLCDASFCYATKNKHALYFDFNHLSNYGALTLEPMFKPMFVSFSKQSKTNYFYPQPKA